jgi:deazaflavin-dependent oxidoreductase (nitroreductase family)
MPRLPGPLIRFLTDAMFRVFRNRLFMGNPVLRLTTVGARSGQERHTVLSYFPEGDSAWIIIASAGGAISHPAWYHNMARHPDQVWIEMGKRKVKVRPQTLEGEERARAWQRVVDKAPGYNGYLTKTDRQIPVVRLSMD